MKKIIPLFPFLFISIFASAQIANNKNWLKPPLTKPFIFDTAFSNSLHKLDFTIKQPIIYTNSFNDVFTLPLDKMPCIITNTSTVAKMPNALSNYNAVTFIPNALPKTELDIK